MRRLPMSSPQEASAEATGKMEFVDVIRNKRDSSWTVMPTWSVGMVGPHTVVAIILYSHGIEADGKDILIHHGLLQR